MEVNIQALDQLYKKACLKRDNGLCQRCIEEGLEIPAVDVHHIVHKAQGLYVRFLMDNGVSLCRQCHDLDAKGELKAWCIGWLGEEKYDQIKLDSHLYSTRQKEYDINKAIEEMKK